MTAESQLLEYLYSIFAMAMSTGTGLVLLVTSLYLSVHKSFSKHAEIISVMPVLEMLLRSQTYDENKIPDVSEMKSPHTVLQIHSNKI